MHFKTFKMDIGLWLIFGGAIILFIWFMLKLTGIINTPFIIQAIPYITVVGIIIGVGIEFGRLLQKIEFFGNGLQEIRNDVRKLEKDMSIVKVKLKIA